MKRVLAVASAGGHWEQMMIFRDVLHKFDVHFATTNPDLALQYGITNATIIPDCNRDTIMSSIRCFISSLNLVFHFRPDVVISTGAAPGFFCILIGRIFGAKTLWIDSVANSEKMSMCGNMSRFLSSRCITQWKNLSREDRPEYVGSVL